MINSSYRLRWIGQSCHRNYTNTRNDEEAKLFKTKTEATQWESEVKILLI